MTEIGDFTRNPTYTDFKESVRLASTASVDISLPGASMDGVSLVYGDTLLLKDQGAPETNGLYTWSAANVPLQRAAGGIDHQISSGMLVIVEEGATHADKIFMLTTDELIETGVTALVFEEFAPAAAPAIVGGQVVDGYAELDATHFSGVTTEQEITGLNITVTGDNTRDMKLTAHFNGLTNAAVSYLGAHIYEGANLGAGVKITGKLYYMQAVANGGISVMLIAKVPPFIGTKRFFMVGGQAGGAANWQLTAAADSKSVLLAEWL